MSYHIVKKHMGEFLSNIKTLDVGRKELIKFRNISIGELSLVNSRNVWFALLLYKFKKELDINDILWLKARKVILSILREENILDTINEYMVDFNLWKQNDYNEFILEVASIYYNLLQIKDSIEETKNNNTISEWKDNYNSLINKVRDSAQKMGFLNKMEEIANNINNKKMSIVEDIMKKAFWDLVEKDITENKYDIIYTILIEIKQHLLDILPNNNDIIDISYIKQRIESNTFDKEYLLELFSSIIEFLKYWDSEEYKKLYDKEYEETINMDIKIETFITIVIKQCMLLTIDLKIRKQLWLKLLQSK